MACIGLTRHSRHQEPVLIQPFSGAHPPPGVWIHHHLPSRTMRAFDAGGDGGVTQSLCRLSARYQPVHAPRMARHGDCVHCQPAGAEPRGLQPLPDGEGLSCALSLRSAPPPPQLFGAAITPGPWLREWFVGAAAPFPKPGDGRNSAIPRRSPPSLTLEYFTTSNKPRKCKSFSAEGGGMPAPAPHSSHQPPARLCPSHGPPW